MYTWLACTPLLTAAGEWPSCGGLLGPLVPNWDHPDFKKVQYVYVQQVWPKFQADRHNLPYIIKIIAHISNTRLKYIFGTEAVYTRTSALKRHFVNN